MRPYLGVEEKDDLLLALELGELDSFAVLVLQSEVRGNVSDLFKKRNVYLFDRGDDD